MLFNRSIRLLTLSITLTLAPSISLCGQKNGSSILQTKLAIVDDAKIANPYDFANSPVFEFRDLMETLQKEMNKRNAKLQEKQIEYQKIRQTLEESEGQPDSDLVAQLKKLEMEVRIDNEAAQQYFAQETNKFHDKVRTVVEAIRAEQGWTHVGSTRAFLCFDAAFDITDEVVKRLNEEYRQAKRAKSFAKSETPKAVAGKSTDKTK